MPDKHNADRRHHIPKMSFKVQNWSAYEAGLRERGSLTWWIEDATLECWQTCGPGGQARYSDAAVTSLLDLIDGRIVQVTADGAYDGDPIYATISAHSDGIEVVIPPRLAAVPSGELDAPTQRDRHLAMITECGRLAWQVATNYGHRSLIGTIMDR
jgi:hypothetical protein